MMLLMPLAMMAAAPSVGVLPLDAPHLSAADQTDFSVRLADAVGATPGVAPRGGPALWATFEGEDLSGCRNDLSCLSELAGGLGVEVLLVPRVEVVGGDHHVAVQAIVDDGSRECTEVVAGAGLVGETLRLCALSLLSGYGSGTGTLRVVSAEDDLELTWDGAPITAEGPVPAGVHRLDAQKEGFIGVSRLVEVAEGAEQEVELSLTPTPEYLDDYVFSAWLVQGTSWAMMGLGVVLTAAGAGTLVGTYFAAGYVNSAIAAYNQQAVRTAEEREALDLQKNVVNFGLLPAGIVVSALGPLVLVGGLSLFLLGDSPGRYE